MKKVGPAVSLCNANYHNLSESKFIYDSHTSFDVHYRIQLNRYFASKIMIWTSYLNLFFISCSHMSLNFQPYARDT